MARASRYLVEGYTYHLTHRCHDRRFLLRFKQEREAYREWLRVGVKRHGVSVYAFCVTSNHTHVVAQVDDARAIGRLMQLPSSTVARQLNRRKQHEGSVWEHPYQCTLIQDGQHLLNCLRYVNLNMVRAGVVPHPCAWRWCCHDELTGRRRRYRILDIERLLERLDIPTAAELGSVYADGIEEALARRTLAREPQWTEAIAVGERAFIASATALFSNRRCFESSPVRTADGAAQWVIRESAEPYVADSAPESTL